MLNGATEKASENWDKIKGNFFDTKGEASNQMAELK
jgi:hypothetical protein